MEDAKMSIERRRAPRISIKIPVKYRFEEKKDLLETIKNWQKTEHHANTLEISLGGMSVELDQPLPKGEILQFDLYLLEKKKFVTTYAEVKWTDKTSAGLKFLMVKEDGLEALKAFLAKQNPE